MNDYPTKSDEDFDATANYNVYRGAAWLDKNKPGWEWLVDLDTLTMSDGNRCVAGQVFNGQNGKRGYDYVFDEYGVAFIVEHGFVYEIHRDLWIEQILARQIVAELELA